jgi:hypothetical protein
MALCKDLSFEECEIAILKHSVEKITNQQGEILMSEPDTIKMVKIAEDFISKKDCVLYGGTAINAMLPKSDQFYNYKYELPDYDAYTPLALDHAKELADIYVKQGFKDVEAKAGVHYGTYKVYVNQHAIMDLTQLHEELYTSIKRHAKVIEGLRYAPVNYLRMSCYLELSRPMGDVSRWEKVYRRLSKLNKYHPLLFKKCKRVPKRRKFSPEETLLFNTSLKTLAGMDVVFIGAYANKLYTYQSNVPFVENLSEFDVISSKPDETCRSMMNALTKAGFIPTLKTHAPIGELIDTHHSIIVNGETIAIVYPPMGCHSYNTVKDKYGNNLKLGTIDTLFSYYLAFLYADREYLEPDRIACVCSILYKVQQDHRITNKKPLQRFGINCYGKQETLSTIRAHRTEMLEKLVPHTRKYDEWFLKYTPKSKTKRFKRSSRKKGI